MKCNICGGEMPYGENVCKYCGNIMPNKVQAEPQKASPSPEPTAEPVRTPHDNIDVPLDAKVYRTPESARKMYCAKCGRPLDGVTNKCIVCERKELANEQINSRLFEEAEEDTMAKRKSKKKKNTTRNIILSILGLIALFALAIWVAVGPIANYLGFDFVIPEKQTPPPSVEYTQKPHNTWEPERTTPEPTEEATKEPTKTPTPHEEGDPVKLRGGKYEYNSHTHLITEEELSKMSRSEIRIIYWEIFARHGLTFDGDLADYFENNHDWYMPTVSSEDEAKAEFNDIEKRNEKTIFNYQKKQGWR